MKKTLIMLILAAAVMLAGTTPTMAANDINCDCDPLGGAPTGIEESYVCSCSSDYTLGKFETKQFLVSCTNGNADPLRTQACVTGQKKSTTCTISVDATNANLTKSCTNWSLTTDGITVTAYCQPDGYSFVEKCS